MTCGAKPVKTKRKFQVHHHTNKVVVWHTYTNENLNRFLCFWVLVKLAADESLGERKISQGRWNSFRREKRHGNFILFYPKKHAEKSKRKMSLEPFSSIFSLSILIASSGEFPGSVFSIIALNPSVSCWIRVNALYWIMYLTN